MNRPCGCACAEDCWRHCCCTTLEERLEWARDNHVTPPDYALAEARAHGIDWESFSKVGPDHESRVCRDGEEYKPCCCGHPHVASSCCASHHGTPANSPIAPSPGVVWLNALACQGQNVNWLGMTVSLPPPADAVLAGTTHVAELAPAPASTYTSLSFAPATPPPRACCS